MLVAAGLAGCRDASQSSEPAARPTAYQDCTHGPRQFGDGSAVDVTMQWDTSNHPFSESAPLFLFQGSPFTGTVKVCAGEGVHVTPTSRRFDETAEAILEFWVRGDPGPVSPSRSSWRCRVSAEISQDPGSIRWKRAGRSLETTRTPERPLHAPSKAMRLSASHDHAARRAFAPLGALCRSRLAEESSPHPAPRLMARTPTLVDRGRHPSLGQRRAADLRRAPAIRLGAQSHGGRAGRVRPDPAVRPQSQRDRDGHGEAQVLAAARRPRAGSAPPRSWAGVTSSGSRASSSSMSLPLVPSAPSWSPAIRRRGCKSKSPARSAPRPAETSRHCSSQQRWSRPSHERDRLATVAGVEGEAGRLFLTWSGVGSRVDSLAQTPDRPWIAEHR